MFAVASQDGVISVWDRRFARTATAINLTGKLAALKTSRPGTLNGASRCVAFSEGPIDLIMFTEQKEYVHLVDARTFEKRQILKLGESEDSTREPDIGGACFSPDGKSFVVANERTVYQWVRSPFLLVRCGLTGFGRKLIRGDENCFRALKCIKVSGE